MATVYEINKGINRSIEFKGIKAQYIMYLGAGLVGLLLLFAILYVIGVNIYVCLAIILTAGGGLITVVQKFSKKYGEHGLMKKIAKRKLPGFISSRSRLVFIQIKQVSNGKK
jgi:hypothetical protein